MPKRPAFANAQAMTRTLKVPDLVSPEVSQAPQACGRHQAVIPPPDLSLSVAHCRAIPRTTRAATAIILVHSHRMAGTISAGTCGTFVPSIPCDSMHSSLILLPGLDDLRKGHLGVIAHYSTDAGWCEEHVCIGHVPTQYYGAQHYIGLTVRITYVTYGTSAWTKDGIFAPGRASAFRRSRGT